MGDASEMGAMSERLRFMGEKIETQIGSIGRLMDDAQGRVGILESKVAVVEMNAQSKAHSLQEIQGMVSIIRGGLNEAMAAISALHDGQSAGQQAPSAPPAAAPPSGPAFDPWAGATFGANKTAAADQPPNFGGQPSPAPGFGNPSSAQAGVGGSVPSFYVGSPLGANGGGNAGPGDQPRPGRFQLYDEKYITLPALTSHRYDQKNPLKWLLATRDYIAGRYPEIDGLLDWVEGQTDPIGDHTMSSVNNGCLPMQDHTPSLSTVSRQLWAMLAPLVDETAIGNTFANCPRHSGLEAWRLIAEPINDDKLIIQKELLGIVMHPKPATNLDKVEDAMTDWDTNLRLFMKAGGKIPDDSTRRLALIELLPLEVASYVTLHIDLPDLATYDKLRKFVLKYVKIQKNLKRAGHRPAHLVDEKPEEEMGDQDGMSEEEAELLEQLAQCEDVEGRIEILAVISKRGFRPPTRGQGGQRRRGPPQTGAAPPPRSRNDIVCINCGRKGHSWGECRQDKKDKSDRPCFECGGTGHIAKDCPKKKARLAGRAPLKAIQDAPVGDKKVSVFCVTEASAAPRRQAPNLGDFIAAKPTQKQRNSNRFQPLTLSDFADAAGEELKLAIGPAQKLDVATSISSKLADTTEFPLPSGGVDDGSTLKILSAKKIPDTNVVGFYSFVAICRCHSLVLGDADCQIDADCQTFPAYRIYDFFGGLGNSGNGDGRSDAAYYYIYGQYGRRADRRDRRQHE
jgi:hypothetical protein